MQRAEPKRENVWLNLGFNIVAPSVILIKGAKIAQMFGVDVSGDKGSLIVFVSALTISARIFNAIIISSSAAFPLLSPIPFIVPSMCSAPASIADMLFAVAIPRSL